MKFTSVLCIAVFFSAAVADRDEWINFKAQYGKNYHGLQEEKLRYSIFQENLNKIQEHNKQFENGHSTFTMAVNRFADMTPEEIRSMLGLRKPNLDTIDSNVNDFVSTEESPDSVDWRTKGAVTDVKDQGSCGSCWSFSVTGTVESQYFLSTGKLLSLSEQELVDCDGTCDGCSGCWPETALDWIKTNGLETEKDYPYEGIDDKCQAVNSSVAVKISGFKGVKRYDESALKDAVAAVGPISVCIDASDKFMFYSSGIFDDPQCLTDALNHAVLAVGYDTSDNNEDYWIVKNSWGLSWGEQGYIRMSRNKKNQCGISSHPYYPII